MGWAWAKFGRFWLSFPPLGAKWRPSTDGVQPFAYFVVETEMWHLLVIWCCLAVTAEAESYCYDNCSNHGQCVNYVCRCDAGWFGENCATSFGSTAPLSVGSMNVTTVEQLNEVCSKHMFCLVGFSAHQCATCYKQEEEYLNTEFHGIPFLRIDAIKHKRLLEDMMMDSTPPEIPFVLVIWDLNRRRGVFTGEQTRDSLTEYALNKAQSSSLVLDWTDLTMPPPINIKPAVIGFFRDMDEEEDREDFAEVAMLFQFRHDVQFYQITTFPRKRNTRGESWFPPLSVALPAIGMLTSRGEYRFTSLADNPNLAKFIQLSFVNNAQQALKLTTQSFLLAEQTKLPMLLLFAPSKQSISRGLLSAFHAAANEFRDQLVLLYDDEFQFANQMHVLGLGGKENNKPVMAINSRNGAIPWNPLLDISPSDIRRFCIDYLAGRAKPLSHQQPAASSSNSNDDEIVGIRETLRDTDVGITPVSNVEAWTTVALDESKDVLMFVYRSSSGGCLDCQHMTPYYKKVAARFHAMRNKGHHVVCAALDLDRHRPKEFTRHMSIPALVLLPAYSKLPPFAHYSSVVKVFSIMEWVRINANRPFTWSEDLPQFDEEEKSMFKIQIKERQDRRIEL